MSYVKSQVTFVPAFLPLFANTKLAVVLDLQGLGVIKAYP
jgi:hypothetical protein